MVYAFLADGFEEMEAVCPIDILRRCEIDVVTVGVGDQCVTGSHGLDFMADIADINVVLDDSIEMIILPGGMPGTLNLEKNHVVQKAIDYCVENNKIIAAICAAPSILGRKNLLVGREAICFPGFENQLYGATLSEKYIVADGNIITAKGAGVSIEFGLKLAELLTSKERADVLRASLQCQS